MKKLLIGTLLIALFFVGYIRDFLFIHLNGQLYITKYQVGQTPMPYTLKWIEGLTYSQTYTLKWVFTFIFTLIYMGISVMIIKLYFNNRRYIKYTLLIFIAFFSVSLLIFLSGYLLGNNDLAYTVSRNIMGWVQSPVMLMLIFPVLYLHDKELI